MLIERVNCPECETLRLLTRLQAGDVAGLLAVWDDMPELPDGWLVTMYHCADCRRLILRAELACELPEVADRLFNRKRGKK